MPKNVKLYSASKIDSLEHSFGFVSVSGTPQDHLDSIARLTSRVYYSGRIHSRVCKAKRLKWSLEKFKDGFQLNALYCRESTRSMLFSPAGKKCSKMYAMFLPRRPLETQVISSVRLGFLGLL